MNEADILSKIITDLVAYFPSEVDIRTDGGDQTVDPPEIIIGWNATDLEDHGGHIPPTINLYEDSGYGDGEFGDGEYGIGDLIGYRRHEYRQMNLTFLARYESEMDAISALSTIEGYFSPFQHRAHNFDSDTFEWEVGNIRATDVAFVEPDWYEQELSVSHGYAKYHDDTPYETLDSISIDMDVDG